MDLLMDVDIFSSEDDDEEILLMIRRPYNLRMRNDHFNIWDDTDFFYRFRMKKETVLSLMLIIEERLQHNWNRTRVLTPLLQLLLTLRFYATGEFLRAIADFSGVSIATACRVVKHVSRVIASLRPEYIKMPSTDEEIQKLQIGFHRMHGFPKVMACVDCTHIRIQSPGGVNAEVFRNRKGYFSINTQVVCDYEMKILDVVSRWPGSAHDATIFSQSNLCRLLEANEFNQALILGDSAYPLKNYLLTPLQNPGTAAEERYNTAHIRTRNSIERLFGVWKRRFPVLSIGVRLKIETIQDIIVATAVLQNICANEKDNFLDVVEDVENNDNDYQLPIHEDNAVRRALITNYFTR